MLRMSALRALAGRYFFGKHSGRGHREVPNNLDLYSLLAENRTGYATLVATNRARGSWFACSESPDMEPATARLAALRPRLRRSRAVGGYSIGRLVASGCLGT
jgi:hypothetical protein